MLQRHWRERKESYLHTQEGDECNFLLRMLHLSCRSIWGGRVVVMDKRNNSEAEDVVPGAWEARGKWAGLIVEPLPGQVGNVAVVGSKHKDQKTDWTGGGQ